MKTIRYDVHFLTLLAAMLILWSTRNLALPARITNFNIIPFGLAGLLHASSIVVSLRNRKAARSIIALCFITLAAVWSITTPIAALWTTVLLAPIMRSMPSSVGVILLFGGGSIIGSSGYWLLVRRFWLKLLRPEDWVKTLALCGAATLLSFFAIGLSRSANFAGLILTVPWWFAFSLSLYWSESGMYVNKSPQVIEATL
jgi:hypothetical protein